jgi:hypothetical protein
MQEQQLARMQHQTTDGVLLPAITPDRLASVPAAQDLIPVLYQLGVT